MAALAGRFAVLRLVGEEEVTGDFALQRDPLAFVDEGRGVIVPWHAVQLAAATADDEETAAEPEPPAGGRHKISVREHESGGWSAMCGCGTWVQTGADKSALLDAAEDHLAAQRRR